MTQISISEAARRWKKSRSTIQAKIKNGQLSLVNPVHDGAGKAKLVDIAELVRVFGEPPTVSEPAQNAGQEVNTVQVENEQLRARVAQLEAVLAVREEQVTDFRQQTERLTHQINPEPALTRLKKWWKGKE